jgi:cytochrome c peroxidase
MGLIEPDLPLDREFSTEVVELGRKIFFDRRLSRSGKTSCATCHDPTFGFADPRPVSVSDNGQLQKRNAPSLYNVGFLPTFLWDGRFKSLEAQALDPFKLNGDMGIEPDGAATRLAGDPDYIRLFMLAFNESPTADLMAKALADFQRSLVSGGTPFDRYIFGEEESALTNDEKRGFEVFTTRAGCLNCHDVFHPRFNPLGGGTALFTDFRFHNLGVGYRFGRSADVGRYYSTRDPDDWAAFRTPTLRNLTLTAPYMHDGSLATLEEVVQLYNRGGNPNPNLSPSIRPLYLSPEEQRVLVAFLKTLTDPRAVELARTTAPQPRPLH